MEVPWKMEFEQNNWLVSIIWGFFCEVEGCRNFTLILENYWIKELLESS